ncbi:hypothetical protein TcWFU_005684 [Taenia crassiceps]|uniref:Uncharacterized protein n=1 Tax=Taenia crassiceps TaxID=6207 RepID=A0ABR4Q4X9_9CEST
MHVYVPMSPARSGLLCYTLRCRTHITYSSLTPTAYPTQPSRLRQQRQVVGSFFSSPPSTSSSTSPTSPSSETCFVTCDRRGRKSSQKVNYATEARNVVVAVLGGGLESARLISRHTLDTRQQIAVPSPTEIGQVYVNASRDSLCPPSGLPRVGGLG